MPDSSTGVSVVVCCYNSSARLPATLEHLARQSLPAGLPVEVIVVDNNSKDRTAETALGEWERLGNPFPLRAIHQPVQGLAYARELGIESAGLEYILLCDDDNWLDPDYIARAFEVMSSDPETGILGGRGEVVSDGPLPHWFSTFQSAYAVGVQAMESGDVSKRGYLWGAGMVLRRPVFLSLKKAGFSSLLADRKGEQLSSGGDSEFCKWFLMAGYTLRYDERLVYRHFIPSERLTTDYFRKMQRGHDQSFRVLKKYDQVLSAQLKSPFRRLLRFLSTGFGLLQSLFLLNENASRFYLEQFSIYIPFGNLGPDPEIRKIRRMNHSAKRTLLADNP